VQPHSGVASPKCFEGEKFGGTKCLTLGEQHYFCLERQFSKHKMTGYQARNQLGTPGGAKSFLRGAQIF